MSMEKFKAIAYQLGEAKTVALDNNTIPFLARREDNRPGLLTHEA